jgi:pyruvate kinase
MDASPGTPKRVPLPHPEIFKAARPGGLLLIDDGKVRLRIVAHDENTIDTEVEVPGTISDRKGVNLPNLVIPLSPMTPKDHKDLSYGLSLGVDWVALSFVQHAHDIAELKKLVAGRAAVMAKLEKPAAIEHLDEIIEQIGDRTRHVDQKQRSQVCDWQPQRHLLLPEHCHQDDKREKTNDYG